MYLRNLALGPISPNPNICYQYLQNRQWSSLLRSFLGKDPATKSDEFLEQFQTAFDPPLIFSKFIRFDSGILPLLKMEVN